MFTAAEIQKVCEAMEWEPEEKVSVEDWAEADTIWIRAQNCLPKIPDYVVWPIVNADEDEAMITWDSPSGIRLASMTEHNSWLRQLHETSAAHAVTIVLTHIIAIGKSVEQRWTIRLRQVSE
ncbi:hypothetical protein AB0B15_02965 [Streptomyces sp. NPDC045456]|uniref:hypothetical protein n=1 Tax=Streptomyces sp. NPDC045456 TaxID=3155254 RepID=UPI00340BD1F9